MEQTGRYAVDEDEGFWLALELHPPEQEERAAREESERDDLDTKGRGGLRRQDRGLRSNVSGNLGCQRAPKSSERMWRPGMP